MGECVGGTDMQTRRLLGPGELGRRIGCGRPGARALHTSLLTSATAAAHPPQGHGHSRSGSGCGARGRVRMRQDRAAATSGRRIAAWGELRANCIFAYIALLWLGGAAPEELRAVQRRLYHDIR